MANRDVIIENLSILKIWFSILSVTDISLVGWLLTNWATIGMFRATASVLTICLLLFAVNIIYRRMTKLINQLGRL